MAEWGPRVWAPGVGGLLGVGTLRAPCSLATSVSQHPVWSSVQRCPQATDRQPEARSGTAQPRAWCMETRARSAEAQAGTQSLGLWGHSDRVASRRDGKVLALDKCTQRGHVLGGQ